MYPRPQGQLRFSEYGLFHLEKVSARGRVRSVYAELDIEQHFRKEDRRSSEAIYTLQLPAKAALLELQVQIGAREPAVRIVHLDAAVAAGEHGATLLLEEVAPGLYAVTLGAVEANEPVRIHYRYAVWLETHAQQARLSIPAAIAPRPFVALAPQFDYPYPFELTVLFEAAPGALFIRCPTHEVKTTKTAEGLAVTLANPVALHRDCVLLFPSRVFAHYAQLAHAPPQWLAMLPWAVPEYPAQTSAPLRLRLLFECSGAMTPDCATHAQHIFSAVLTHLHHPDCLSVLCFGDLLQPLTEGWQCVTPALLEQLRAATPRLQENLAGADLPQALDHLATRLPTEPSADVLLITAGNPWDCLEVLSTASERGQRVFVLALGERPVRDQVRDLAALTGGAYELLTAGEGSDAAVARMMKRIRAPAYRVQAVHWPQPPAWSTVLTPAVFPGDTVQVLAGFDSVPQGAVNLEIHDAQGEGLELAARRLDTIESSAGVLQQLAAAWRLDENTTAALLQRRRAEAARVYARARAVIEQIEEDGLSSGPRLASEVFLDMTSLSQKQNPTPVRVLDGVLQGLRAGEELPLGFESLREFGMPQLGIQQLRRENEQAPRLPEHLLLRLWLMLMFRKFWPTTNEPALQALLNDPKERALLLMRPGLQRLVEELSADGWTLLQVKMISRPLQQ
jgi:Ca-activated chloride channel family protein